MSLFTILYNIILSPIVQLIEISYRLFNQLFKNTGVAVLGVSLTVTLFCLPLYIVAEKWEDEERSIQARLKNGVARIKKFFSGDERYMILTTYYKQNHYHPIMSLRSSFGILIQIPFFLAAYHTLSSLPDFQGKAFLFIKDMGKPDAIFSIGGFAINILPILMTAINCVSGAIYSKGHGLREKVQIYGMALVFLVLLYNSPAGLVTYWTMNNIFSLVKNVFYKMKNPLKVLYICFCIAVIAVIIYIWAFYSKSAGLNKKIPATVALILALPIPIYIRGIKKLLSGPLKTFVENRALRLSVFIISAAGLVLLAGFVLPSSLIASSTQEFSDIDSYKNPAIFLLSSFWISFGLFFFWPFCIYFLFKEKVQTIISVFFLFLLLSGTVNAFAFAGNYGSMDATLKFIDGIGKTTVLFKLLNSLLVFVVLFAIIIAIKFKGARILRSLGIIIITVFSVISVKEIITIFSDYSNYEAKKIANEATANDSSIRYHLSKTEKNVIVFMLDRFENSYIRYILKDLPSLKDKLSGFVYYPNTVAFNGHTLMGAPGVYGGYEYTPMEMNKRENVSLKEKHNEALSVLPLVLGKAGFESTLSDLSWANYEWEADMTFAKNLPHTKGIRVLGKYTSDFKKEKLIAADSSISLGHILNRNLFWTSIFRISPAVLRPIVYYKGTWWENGTKQTSSSFVEWFSALYYMNKITAVDSDSPTLNVITNEASHSSEDISMYDLGLPKTLSFPKELSYPVDFAVLREIANFCDFLKDNGAYDNTRIIIASDHGIGVSEIAKEDFTTPDLDGYSKDHFHPILLVKDFGATGTLSQDNAFMTNADVPALAFAGIVEDAVNPFTEKIISIKTSNEYKAEGVYITRQNLFMPGHSKSKYIFTLSPDSWYNVKDNIFIDSNWKKIN